jgi:hypothetical protein
MRRKGIEGRRMKFVAGDLVFDIELSMTGMIMEVYTRKETLGRGQQSQSKLEKWYKVMLSGDKWCIDGRTREYAVRHGDNLLERYDTEKHKGLSRESALLDVDKLSKASPESFPIKEE